MEKAVASHSSTLAWKIPWMEEPGSCGPWGRWELDMTEQLHFHLIRAHWPIVPSRAVLLQYLLATCGCLNLSEYKVELYNQFLHYTGHISRVG